MALDVYEEEEGIFFEDHSSNVLQDDELNLLLSFPNVLITSHQAFLTHEALSEITRVTTENILKLKTGKPFLPATLITDAVTLTGQRGTGASNELTWLRPVTHVRESKIGQRNRRRAKEKNQANPILLPNHSHNHPPLCRGR